MRTLMFAVLVVVPAVVYAGPKPGASIRGDYVEARTASVFAGACHYNGEVVSTGRDAILAWNIRSGTWNGVDLTGLSAVAVVKSSDNLKFSADRQSELVIAESATGAQAAALKDALETGYGATLGKVIGVRRAPVLFSHRSSRYQVEAKGIAALTVEAMPNHECCTQPHLVWYDPLIQLKQRRVGFTQHVAFQGSALGDPWSHSEENSAFYGSFAL